MRTTLDIDDDVMEEARELSRRQSQSLGKTISDLVRRGLKKPEPRIVMKNGVPVWMPPPGTPPTTNELLDAEREREFRD